jgi:hypothetical protein
MECVFTSNGKRLCFVIGLNIRPYRFEMEALVYTFYLNTVTINSSVENLVERCKYAYIKHRNDGGCVKIKIY